MSLTAIVYLSPDLIARATELASALKVACIDACHLSGAKDKVIERHLSSRLGCERPTVLILDGTGLRLQLFGQVQGAIRADFHGPSVTYRRKRGGGRGQMLAKAVGLKHGQCPTVLDCTAGLGRDAFVLASLGCVVTLLERDPVVHALLADGLQQARAQAIAELDIILARMSLEAADAHAYLKHAQARPDVIYLDPMFPERHKSALVKKEMQVLQGLIGPDADADELLSAALGLAQQRVVVKRPRIAPNLAHRTPSYMLEGKSNRYDIFLV